MVNLSKSIHLRFLSYLFYFGFFCHILLPNRSSQKSHHVSHDFQKVSNGFDPKRARTKAFGAGINVSSEFNEVLRYAPDDEPCIIFCIVTYHRAMLNESDVTQMIHEVREDGAEVWYSKPTYMHPPWGYNVLCCDKIWVFPSSEQVIPIFFIPCQKLLPAN